MTKFEEKKKEAYEKASMKQFGNADGSRAMRYLLNELENAGLLKEHQALPVVFKDVAEWIEILKSKGLKPLKNPETYGETGFTEEKLQNIVFWISEHQEDYMRAWLDGYTIEKPQLFYLKDNLTGMYLYKIMIAYNEGIKGYKWNTPTKKGLGAGNYKFTQQEIDSMQTGSYEQIEV
ncbi:DUF1642 domain-containing protein [Lactococcus taiwanensis]|uniref:DUF1642 domain-containing protein n=1 Tax=Lactococcus taiwanensis TaxID=1151742 RepID=UPI0028AD786E|nr:DUF1642 domain-containing protein [Lactococcus taiwanensis]